MQRTLTSCPEGFKADSEYIAAEFRFIATRAARLAWEARAGVASKQGCERERPEQSPTIEADRRARRLLEDERVVREEIDLRLAAHRANPRLRRLGLDQLCEEYCLSGQERLVILAAATPDISRLKSARMPGEIRSTLPPRVTVADVIRLLDPHGIGDWLMFRKIFRANAPLRRARLVDVGRPHGGTNAASLTRLELRLTHKTFLTLFDPSDEEPAD